MSYHSYHGLLGADILKIEVVLSRLFSEYKISPAAGKDVIWMMGGTMYPAIRGADESKSQLPVHVIPLAKALD